MNLLFTIKTQIATVIIEIDSN